MQWVRMFVKWHGLRHPRDMGQLEIESFLAMLAERAAGGGCHAHSVRWVFAAIPLPVLGVTVPWLDGVQRPRTPSAFLGFDGGWGGCSAIGAAVDRYGLAGPTAVRYRHAADGRPALAGQGRRF